LRLFGWTKEISSNGAELELERRLQNPLYLESFGYKVFSQNDEDGILAEIFRRVGAPHKTFVEFGVQDGLESNGHFLLHQGWRGLWIEGSPKYCKKIKTLFQKPLEQKQLALQNAFITKENIAQLIETNIPFSKDELDLLSIDIDGNDYWVWESILESGIRPRVVAIEYNSLFPPTHEWVMPYNASHRWDKSDFFGVSLKSLELLGRAHGYQLVGTGLTGTNAFFVESSLAQDLFVLPASAETLYTPARPRIVYRSRFPSKYYTGVLP
jgi:hypothetical protein